MLRSGGASANRLTDHQLIARADLLQTAVDPLLGQLFLYSVLRQTGAKVREVYVVHLLVLIEARENHGLLARYRIFVLLQALRANLFHHALHGRVDTGDRLVPVLEIGGQNSVPRALY